MIGYRELSKAIIDGYKVKKVFVYIDACPYRQGMSSLPPGVILIEPDDTTDISFAVLNKLTVHLIGGDEKRVKAFADRIWQFRPTRIVANWGEAMEIIG